MVLDRSLGWRDGHAEELCTRGTSSAEGFALALTGHGRCSELSLAFAWRRWRQARRIWARAVMESLTQKGLWFSQTVNASLSGGSGWGQGHSGRAWSCSLVHVGGLGAVQEGPQSKLWVCPEWRWSCGFQDSVAPRFLAVVPTHAYTDGKSKIAGSQLLPGWAVAEQHWGLFILPVGWKCSLALGKGEGAPGVTGSCAVIPLCVFSSLFSWMSSAP